MIVLVKLIIVSTEQELFWLKGCLDQSSILKEVAEGALQKRITFKNSKRRMVQWREKYFGKCPSHDVVDGWMVVRTFKWLWNEWWCDKTVWSNPQLVCADDAINWVRSWVEIVNFGDRGRMSILKGNACHKMAFPSERDGPSQCTIGVNGELKVVKNFKYSEEIINMDTSKYAEAKNEVSEHEEILGVYWEPVWKEIECIVLCFLIVGQVREEKVTIRRT